MLSDLPDVVGQFRENNRHFCRVRPLGGLNNPILHVKSLRPDHCIGIVWKEGVS
jgi:hypothetical protein